MAEKQNDDNDPTIDDLMNDLVGGTLVFKARDRASGVIHETEISRAQALDYAAGDGFGGTVHDLEVLVDEDGEITERDSITMSSTEEDLT